MPSISIDTYLASQYEKELIDYGIKSYLFHTKDEKFSAYIDAVNQKIGSFSFCDEKK